MNEDFLSTLGHLALGSRLKRLGERLQADTQRVIDAAGLPVQAAQFPLLAAVERLGPSSVGALAGALGVTQPGVTRAVGQLARAGLVTVEQPADDQRRRIVALSAAGIALVAAGRETVWPRVEVAVRELCAGLSGPLLAQLAAIEAGLDEAPLDRRAARRGATR